MQLALLIIPLGILIVTMVYGVTQSLLGSWLDYRLKLNYLDKLEKHPELIDRSNSSADGSSPTQAPHLVAKQNYFLTGAILVALGLFFVFGGRLVRVGEFAVGAYLGGILCVLLGLPLAGVGLLIRYLAKDPTEALRGS
ncbi:MAG: hypothetical protein GY851_33535 [bacterium]|nr:hypothetical protein [bacterium]